MIVVEAKEKASEHRKKISELFVFMESVVAKPKKSLILALQK